MCFLFLLGCPFYCIQSQNFFVCPGTWSWDLIQGLAFELPGILSRKCCGQPERALYFFLYEMQDVFLPLKFSNFVLSGFRFFNIKKYFDDFSPFSYHLHLYLILIILIFSSFILTIIFYNLYILSFCHTLWLFLIFWVDLKLTFLF